jgi:hypothetical protein
MFLMTKHIFSNPNKALKRINAPKRKDVAGGWRRLHNEKLHNLYTSPIIIRVIKSRRMRWVRHEVRMGKMRNAHKILVRHREGKRTLRRTRMGR